MTRKNSVKDIHMKKIIVCATGDKIDDLIDALSSLIDDLDLSSFSSISSNNGDVVPSFYTSGPEYEIAADISECSDDIHVSTEIKEMLGQ